MKKFILLFLVTNTALANYDLVKGVGVGQGSYTEAFSQANMNAEYHAQELCTSVGGDYRLASTVVVQKDCDAINSFTYRCEVIVEGDCKMDSDW